MATVPGVVIAEQDVDFGAAAIREVDADGGRLLTVNNVPQSFVNVTDPTKLGFDYTHWVAVTIDAVAPAGEPIRVLTLGGGGMTLPRYVAATRPGSRQVVVEADRALSEFVSKRLPLPDDADVELLVADAYDAARDLPTDEFDLVINDVYRVTHLPSHLVGTPFAAEMARILKPDGLYTLNILDLEQLRVTRAQLATLRTQFTDTCVVAAHTELGTKDFLNAVVSATNGASGIPITDLKEASLRRRVPVALIHGQVIDTFTAGVTVDSPPE